MKLYRYRQASVNTFSEIASGKAWHSRYSELNDPFEGLYINRSREGDLDALVSALRTCCFSTRCDSLLLWAHYADSHRGLCLEYELTNDEFRGQFFPVRYSNELPVLEAIARFPEGSPNAGHLHLRIDREAAIFLTKSKDWAYEEEFRTIRFAQNPSAPGELGVLPGRLTGIYFGLRTASTVVTTVDRLLSTDRSIPFFRAELTAGSFTLSFTSVSRASMSLP